MSPRTHDKLLRQWDLKAWTNSFLGVFQLQRESGDRPDVEDATMKPSSTLKTPQQHWAFLLPVFCLKPCPEICVEDLTCLPLI